MKMLPRIFSALLVPLLLTLFCPQIVPCSAAESDGDAAAKAVNAFAIDLYGQLRDGKGNIFFSPYSISASLAIAYAGARGKTESQMAKTLHFSLEKAKNNGSFRALNEQVLLAGHGKGIALNIANALWAEKSFKFKKEFLKTVRINFLPHRGWFWPGDPGCLRQVDFRHAPEFARKTINSWVEHQTGNKIKDLMGPGSISSDTRLVITNAIYFKGLWNSQFEKKLTKQDNFTLLDGTKIKVPMMSQTKSFGYAEEPGLQILEMPYRGEALSMVVLLPRKKKNFVTLHRDERNLWASLLANYTSWSSALVISNSHNPRSERSQIFDEFEHSLSLDKLHRWTGNLERQVVEVHFPKFKMVSSYQLPPTLTKLGMIDAFSLADADFSGMTSDKDLFIENAVHKAFVDVYEEGTEAAASTGWSIGVTGAYIPPPAPVFRADHPFVFLIWHKPSRCILFMGRVLKP